MATKVYIQTQVLLSHLEWKDTDLDSKFYLPVTYLSI